MKFKFLYIFILSFILGLFAKDIYNFKEKKKKINFSKWPQLNFKNVRVLIASHPYLASQGFAGAEEAEFENTIIIFPNINKLQPIVFSNKNEGFGYVKKNIKIYYLDKNFRIIGKDIIKKKEGISSPPSETAIAIEGLP